MNRFTLPRHFTDILLSVRGLKESGKPDSWYGYCPVHQPLETKKRSLGISIGKKGNLVFRCCSSHGCSAEEIIRALGFRMRDAFADQSFGKPCGEFVCSYPYRDEGGRLLYEVVRFANPKDFRQRQPNPTYDKSRPLSESNKKYLWHLQGVRRVLYRLPELLRELRRSCEPVVIAEGEKDVDRLWRIRVMATTAPGGACKFQGVEDHARELLRGRNVIVLADDDPFNDRLGCRPGPRHAYDVAARLNGHVKAIKVVRFFNDGQKKDVSDFLAGGIAREQKARLWSFVAQCPTFDGTVPSYVYRGELPKDQQQRANFDDRVHGVLSRLAARKTETTKDQMAVIEEVKARCRDLMKVYGRSHDEFLGQLAALAAAIRLMGGDLEGMEDTE